MGEGGEIQSRRKGRTVGKDTERTRKVATPKRKTQTHKAKCRRREGEK